MNAVLEPNVKQPIIRNFAQMSANSLYGGGPIADIDNGQKM